MWNRGEIQDINAILEAWKRIQDFESSYLKFKLKQKAQEAKKLKEFNLKAESTKQSIAPSSIVMRLVVQKIEIRRCIYLHRWPKTCYWKT